MVTDKIGRRDLLPKSKLPFLIVWGKHRGLDAAEGGKVYPDEIKEALYADPAVAAAVTGFFRLERVAENIDLHLQLRGGRSPEENLTSRLQSRLADFVRPPLNVVFHNHRDYPFATGESFDRKPTYL
jgi:acyl-CoA synthetase (AMP-forming)/AMP-acid ligase II